MPTAAVTLTEPLNTFVDEQVKSGLYPDRDSVVADALGRLREQMAEDDAKMAALDARLQESWEAVQRGECTEVTDIKAYFDDVMARVRAR